MWLLKKSIRLKSQVGFAALEKLTDDDDDDDDNDGDVDINRKVLASI
jgi:hypothetical protein